MLGGAVKDVLTGAVPRCHNDVWCPSVWHLRLNMSDHTFFRIIPLLDGHGHADLQHLY